MQSPGDQQGGFGEPKLDDEQHPWYVKYGVRALGTFAGGLCLLLGALNVIFSVFSPTCMLFSIWQMLVGFLVVTIEAPFCCAFVDNVQVLTRKIEEKPLWIKAAVYVFAPLPTIVFCIGFYSVIGGGAVLGAGVVYAMIALGKKASREEMARNAQSMNTSNETYQTQPPPPSSHEKNPFATVNILRDPVQAAAAQWASQSTPSRPQTFEPPPSYSSSISNNQNRTAGWDQSFVNETPSSRPVTSYGINPASSDPHNPFQ